MQRGIRTAAGVLLLAASAHPAFAQVRDTSYTATTGERVLRVEVDVMAPVDDVWKAISTSEGLSTWLASDLVIDLKTGGSITTRTGTGSAIGNTGATAVDVVNYLDRELVTFRIHLDERFSETIRGDDDRLQEIVRLIPMGTRTTVISSMVGWGAGRIWDDAYAFFRKRLQDSYARLASRFNAGRP